QNQISFLDQPAVQVDFVIEFGEAVIRYHHAVQTAQLLVPHAIIHTAHHGVQLLIPGLDDIHPIATEHMLDAVQRVKHRSDHPLAEASELVEQYLLARAEDRIAQVQKLLI